MKSARNKQRQQPDVIQRLLSDWRRERPDLNPSAMDVVGRVLSLGKKLEMRANAALEPYGIAYTDLDVLATLRRSGPPYMLTPTALQRSVLITSGSMTACLKRLQNAGLVRRHADERDGRSLTATLTASGKRLIDAAIAARFSEARQAVEHLSGAERAQLARLLRKLEHGLGTAE